MKKVWIAILLLIVLLLGLLCGIFWYMHTHVLIGTKFYPKDIQVLDLRQETITPNQYKNLCKELPNAQILWNVKFQGKLYPNDTEELTVSTLSDGDVAQLQYFPKLTVLHADQCRDYAQLMAARTAYPHLQIPYSIPMAGEAYAPEAAELILPSITEEEVGLLKFFPNLKMLALSSAQTPEVAVATQTYCEDNGAAFYITLGQERFSTDAAEVTAEGITEEQLLLLPLMKNLKSIHLITPEVSAQTLLSLRKDRSDLNVTWEVDICGLRCADDMEEVDLSQQTIGSVEEVEQGMAYLPNVTNVFLGFCGLDNEEIAAYRERSRENYKVVWVVDLSGKMKVRTDIDNFMPSRDGWGYVRDHEVDNIRYCEDLICIDLGHMGIKDVSFLETLVNLEYLILAHTEVQYVDAIVNCQKLRFLELDWSCIRDFTPLVELKALEDLNVGQTYADLTPLMQMTWLKNLYVINRPCNVPLCVALPDTRVALSGTATVGSGWRRLPNYYKMRDILGMYYMN